MIQFKKRIADGSLHNWERIAHEFDMELLVAKLLCERGYDTEEKVAIFLHPDESQLINPEQFEQMFDAMDCLYAAKSMEEVICIYGDYDVDGVSATAILYQYLESEGFLVRYYIPSRHEEGYGLNRKAIEQLATEGVSVLVTVDCGITALAEIDYASELGMEVIVTDHHQCLDELPQCAAIINPQASAYPNKALCGAGVALKIVQAMGGIEKAMQYIDIASVATVADIVSLTGENRAIVALGLKKMRQGNANIGLHALMEASNLSPKAMQAQNIAYGLAPRINAMGRLEHATKGLELLLAKTEEEAKIIALKLNKKNEERRQIERAMFEECVQRIELGEVDIVHQSAILLCGDEWNAGLIGIVAARLVKRYYKPVFLFAGAGDEWVASGRSIEGVNLFQAMNAFASYFERYGGHAMAGGLSIKKEKYSIFSEKFLAYLSQEIPKELFIPSIYFDLQINSPQELTDALYDQLQTLAPFGTGNVQPKIYLENVEMDTVRSMGKEVQHLKLIQGNKEFVAFQQGESLQMAQRNVLSLIGSLEMNEWMGKRQTQFLIDAMKPNYPINLNEYFEKEQWRFADAMYRDIKQLISVKQVQKTWDEESSNIKEELCKRSQGVLLVCRTPQGAKQTVAFLKENQLFDSMTLEWNRVRDKRAYNTLLLAPDWDEIDPLFDSVFIMDSLPIGFLEKTNQYTQLAEPKNEFLQEIAVDRSELIGLYKAMCHLAVRKQSFLDDETYYEALETLVPVNRSTICAGVRIFEELEFVTVDRTNFSVNTIENPTKKELTESVIYSYLQGFQPEPCENDL